VANNTPSLSSYAFNKYGHDAKLYNGIAELEERIRTLEAEREWQPIETAPCDGKLVLTFAIVDSATGNWNMKISCRWGDDKRDGWLNWHGTSGPTHWMPLPSPPGAARKGATEAALASETGEPKP